MLASILEATIGEKLLASLMQASAGNGKTKSKHAILIVDDEPEVLASLRALFRREYQVLAADGGSSALDVLENNPNVHVVITDQRMPGMTGAELLAQVRKRHPDVMRLMMTGYADVNSVIGAINEGNVYRYIGKPWDTDELASVLRQAVEQYELMAERRRLLAELQEANRLKTAFITVASHELNTPLTILLGMLNLAISKNGDPSISNYLDRSLKAADRLHRRLQNTFKLLEHGDFSKVLTPTEVTAKQLFDEIQADLGPIFAARKQTLSTSIEPTDHVLYASRSHIRDVLEALVTNAVKFSPDGASIELSARAEGDGTTLEVRDRGVGICAEDLPHVFEPLFSTMDTMKHSTGDYGYCKRGMGLGLAIAKRFVEMHGGSITCESKPNDGTTFRIRLPGRGTSTEVVNEG